MHSVTCNIWMFLFEMYFISILLNALHDVRLEVANRAKERLRLRLYTGVEATLKTCSVFFVANIESVA